jgi:hypothetical protein
MFWYRVHEREEAALTPDERRRFRRLEHGLRVTDPDWLTRHGSCRRRYGGPVRSAVATLSLALLVVGALTGLMLVVFCGVVLASGALTSHVSSRSRALGSPPPRSVRRPGSPHDGARS